MAFKAFKKIVQSFINQTGYELTRKQQAQVQPRAKLIDRVQNLKNLAFEPHVILDGGAHIGNWTKVVAKIFPYSKYILVEPNPVVAHKIKARLANRAIDYTVVPKAIGYPAGHQELNTWEDTDIHQADSSFHDHVRGESNKKLPVEVVELDSLIDIYHAPPAMVKLDLQGAELQALQGAVRTLEHAECFIIEFGTIESYQNRTTVKQLIDFMYEYHYRLYDIIDMRYRPYDFALGGGDFIFIKNTSRLNEYQGWV